MFGDPSSISGPIVPHVSKEKDLKGHGQDIRRGPFGRFMTGRGSRHRSSTGAGGTGIPIRLFVRRRGGGGGACRGGHTRLTRTACRGGGNCGFGWYYFE